MLQLAETDLAAQARITAAQVAKAAQAGAKNAGEGFNRFVEGTSSNEGRYRSAPLDESKKDFWDSFAEAGAERQRPSAIGTSAVRGGSGSAGNSAVKAKADEHAWDKW